jgi:hypothetical protein
MEYRSLRVRVIGPLEPFADGFRAELAERGYKAWSAKHQLPSCGTPESLAGEPGLGSG